MNLTLMRRVTFFVLLISLFVFTQGKTDNKAFASPSDEKSGRIIVKFLALTPGFYKDSVFQKNQVAREEKLLLADTHLIEVSESSVGKVVKALKRNFLVDYAEEDYIASKTLVPDDPYFSSQWGLAKIEAPQAWEVSKGSVNVDVAIVDTGINVNHPDLASKLAVSVNCTLSSCPAQNTTDPDGHGTHVAGIASAVTNNANGIAGVSWEGRLMSVKALSDTGSGYYSWISNAIVWSADNGAEVINLSLGGSSYSWTLENAINYAWGKGVVVVAAAGNNGSNFPFYPAYFNNSIAVAAVDKSDKKASFSNYGWWVDVAAPGVSILSTYRDNYGELSGTSMASPFVSGLAGLLKAHNPSWNNVKIRNKVESSADAIAGTGTNWVHGRINLCKALDCYSSSEVTPSPTPINTSAPTPTNTTTPTPTSTHTPTPTQISSPTPTPTSLPTPTPTAVIPTPTPSNLPWWCVYIPWHYTCQ